MTQAEGPIAVPIIYEQLKPASVVPGGADFTLNVLGNFFHYGSVVYWNNSPLVTTVSSTRFISAVVPAALTAKSQSAAIRGLNSHPYGAGHNNYCPVSPQLVIFFGLSNGRFSSPTSFSFDASTAYAGLALGDFNNDGKTDLISATQEYELLEN